MKYTLGSLTAILIVEVTAIVVLAIWGGNQEIEHIVAATAPVVAVLIALVKVGDLHELVERNHAETLRKNNHAE